MKSTFFLLKWCLFVILPCQYIMIIGGFTLKHIICQCIIKRLYKAHYFKLLKQAFLNCFVLEKFEPCVWVILTNLFLLSTSRMPLKIENIQLELVFHSNFFLKHPLRSTDLSQIWVHWSIPNYLSNFSVFISSSVSVYNIFRREFWNKWITEWHVHVFWRWIYHNICTSIKYDSLYLFTKP